MKRISYSELLRNSSIDINREYGRLYELFAMKNCSEDLLTPITLREYCSQSFMRFPFRGTAISLDDFEESLHLNFIESPNNFDLDYLILFCEHTYNLVFHSKGSIRFCLDFTISKLRQEYLDQVLLVIDKIGYITSVSDEGLTNFVPENSAAIEVAQIVEPDLGYNVIQYNHHSLKGNLSKKRQILYDFANDLEPQRGKIKKMNHSLEQDLFSLINSLDIRHNNSDENSKYYHPCVASMNKDDKEKWYDAIYQLILLAYLELEYGDKKFSIDELEKLMKNGEIVRA